MERSRGSEAALQGALEESQGRQGALEKALVEREDALEALKVVVEGLRGAAEGMEGGLSPDEARSREEEWEVEREDALQVGFFSAWFMWAGKNSHSPWFSDYIFLVQQEAQRLKGRIKRLEGEAQDLKNELEKERREREEEGERARVAIEEAAAAAAAVTKAAGKDEVRCHSRVSRVFQRLQVAARHAHQHPHTCRSLPKMRPHHCADQDMRQ